MSFKDNFKFVVVGGGTAGWLSALYLQNNFSNANITVVASTEIGILGAGEGTVINIIGFLKELNISIEDVIKHAKGSIKNGIKFTNWNGDNTSYFHPFISDDFEKYMPLYEQQISNDKSLDEVIPHAIYSAKNQLFVDKDSLESINDLHFALHFDANCFAQYLKSVALSRNINYIDDEVLSIETDNEQFINKLILKSNKIIDVDFALDCSGFHRLIIGKFYGSKWHSYKKLLPVNRAMPFFIDNTKQELPPYTEAIAMKYGWMWKIPVQGRYGCGYVFDSSFVSDEDIKKEVEDYLGHSINSPKMFNFNAGRFDKTWIKNCIAIGLSSGFTEPMEATSIFISIQSLENIRRFVHGITEKNQTDIDEYNNIISNLNEEIVLFLHYHYLGQRNDSEFWKTFREKNPTPVMIKNWLEISKDRLPKKYELDYLINLAYDNNISRTKRTWYNFGLLSWIIVGAGLKNYTISNCSQIKNIELKPYDNLISHNEYIGILKETNVAAHF